MKNFKKNILLPILFLGLGANAQQVGIKDANTTPSETFPATSASLDVYSPSKGILFPKHDLLELNNPKSPVNLQADIDKNRIVDGTIIFNKGGQSPYPRGYYTWIKDKWVLILYKGSEPQQGSFSIPANTQLIPNGTTKGDRNNVINGIVEAETNNIEGSSFSGNTIRLPRGKYVYKYDVDTFNTSNAAPNFIGDFNGYSMITFLRKKGSTEPITDVQRFTKVGARASFAIDTRPESIYSFIPMRGMFILDLDQDTELEQIINYDTDSSTNAGLGIRTSFTVSITKVQ